MDAQIFEHSGFFNTHHDLDLTDEEILDMLSNVFFLKEIKTKNYFTSINSVQDLVMNIRRIEYLQIDDEYLESTLIPQMYKSMESLLLSRDQFDLASLIKLIMCERQKSTKYCFGFTRCLSNTDKFNYNAIVNLMREKHDWNLLSYFRHCVATTEQTFGSQYFINIDSVKSNLIRSNEEIHSLLNDVTNDVFSSFSQRHPDVKWMISGGFSLYLICRKVKADPNMDIDIWFSSDKDMKIFLNYIVGDESHPIKISTPKTESKSHCLLTVEGIGKYKFQLIYRYYHHYYEVPESFDLPIVKHYVSNRETSIHVDAVTGISTMSIDSNLVSLPHCKGEVYRRDRLKRTKERIDKYRSRGFRMIFDKPWKINSPVHHLIRSKDEYDRLPKADPVVHVEIYNFSNGPISRFISSVSLVPMKTFESSYCGDEEVKGPWVDRHLERFEEKNLRIMDKYKESIPWYHMTKQVLRSKLNEEKYELLRSQIGFMDRHNHLNDVSKVSTYNMMVTRNELKYLPIVKLDKFFESEVKFSNVFDVILETTFSECRSDSMKLKLSVFSKRLGLTPFNFAGPNDGIWWDTYRSDVRGRYNRRYENGETLYFKISAKYTNINTVSYQSNGHIRRTIDEINERLPGNNLFPSVSKFFASYILSRVYI